MGRRRLGVFMGAALLLAGVSSGRAEHVAQAAGPDATPRSPGSRQGSAATSAARVTRKISDATVGHLEHPARLASLFARFEALEAHQTKTDVRIIQLGDSHTASDYGTSVARARLAQRFGDGGRGFIPMGPPHRRQFQAGESMTRSAAFQPDEAANTGKRLGPQGFFGPTGVAMDARATGATMSSELTASADRFEIAYLGQPGGGSFDVYVDGQRLGRVVTDQAVRGSAFRTFAVARGPHSLEVRAVGDAAVRIFGVRLDDDAVGVTLDSLGMNGAKATTLLASDEAHLGEQMAHIAPALVVVAYGTNESGDSTTTPADHAVAVRSLVHRVKKGAPSAECVVLGPPDRAARGPAGVHTLPKLGDIIAAQRRAADDAGCAFYDQFAAMGSSDAIGRWANESPPRARRDLVHLTRAGYSVVAEALVRDMLAAYGVWKGDSPVAGR